MGSELKLVFFRWRHGTEEIFVFVSKTLISMSLGNLISTNWKNFPFLVTSGERNRMGSELKLDFLRWRHVEEEIFVFVSKTLINMSLGNLISMNWKNFPFLVTSGERNRMGSDFKSGFSSVAA